MHRKLGLLLVAGCSALGCKKPRQPAPVEVVPQLVAAKAFDASVAGAVPLDARRSRGDFVDLRSLLPEVSLDMRYASTNNFLGKAMYSSGTCLLRDLAAQAILQVQSALKEHGLELLIWDCYRPFSVQEEFWQHMPNPRYVAKPIREGDRLLKGSKHNRGAAVDLTLKRIGGAIVPMPTDHDDFSSSAHWPESAKVFKDDETWRNAERLRKAMEKAGFQGIESEWWHFDFQGWADFELADQPL